MKKRIWSASALVCALLLLLSSASLAKSSNPDVGEGPDGKARIGARVVPPPMSLYGDDDSPNEPKDDDGDVDGTGGKGSIASADGKTSWRLKDFWASFRLQLLTVLRVWK